MVRQLGGNKYLHEWSFREDLARRSSFWREQANIHYNAKLKQDLDSLISLFRKIKVCYRGLFTMPNDCTWLFPLIDQFSLPRFCIVTVIQYDPVKHKMLATVTHGNL